MSFIGNLAAASGAKAIGKYNASVAYQEALYERKKAAVKEKVYKKMITYLDYVQEQENMLSLTETKKDNYAKTFFEQDTQETNEIVNTI